MCNDNPQVLLSINLGNFGSTGKIMRGISSVAEESGMVAYQAYPENRNNLSKQERDIIICSYYSTRINERLAYYTGMRGYQGFFSTLNFLRKIKKINPDIIHLHNLHSNYVNLPLLFRYLKKCKKKIIWTLHDCWSFTGQCPHFTIVKCDKWKTGCYNCPSYHEYPSSKVDRTKKMWKLKKKWFSNVPNLTIVTPSQWLADLVKQSYLKDYPVRVIHNGIDLSFFKPTESDFRKKHGIPASKKILLGVSFDWGIKKGLDVFIELSKRLSSDEYQIVLVGTDSYVDSLLPQDIISIHRTQNQNELAEIYTAADLFVNPTREEVLGLVNIEALACGTPVITFNSGGSPECIDKFCGVVVKCDDVDAMEREIKRLCLNDVYDGTSCMERAKYFDNIVRIKEYVSLYDTVVGG